MRVATFNILHGRSATTGLVEEDGLRAAAREIDADVVGLQEVDRSQPRSGGVDQTAVFADALGACWWRFVPALHGTPGATWTTATVDDPAGPETTGPAYGVGLVSRLPVRHWSVRRFGPAPVGMPLMVPGTKGLSHVDDEPRVAVVAALETSSGPLTVVTTHLSFVPGWNVAQLRALARWARTFPGPRILLGDFNLPGALPRLVTRWSQPARVPTYPASGPRVQLDHLLLDGVAGTAVREVRAMRLPVSDHCALVVDLDV